MDQSRIPSIQGNSFTSMREWFGEMYEKRLLFHPDDPPETIIVINTNLPMFTKDESHRLSQVLDLFFARFGNRVYDAAYPYFMRSIGNPEN